MNSSNRCEQGKKIFAHATRCALGILSDCNPPLDRLGGEMIGITRLASGNGHLAFVPDGRRAALDREHPRLAADKGHRQAGARRGRQGERAAVPELQRPTCSEPRETSAMPTREQSSRCRLSRRMNVLEHRLVKN